MAVRYIIVFLVFAFALLPLVLPARQAAVGESANIAVSTSPEAAAVLELVKDLDDQ